MFDLSTLSSIVRKSAGEAVLEKIFREQNVPITVLDQPDSHILFRDRMGLYHRASLETGEISIGLLVGEEITLEKYGVFGRYLLSAASLEQEFLRASSGLGLLENDSNWRLASVDRDTVRWSFTHGEQGAIGWRHIADLKLALAVSTVRNFAGVAWSPFRIEVSYGDGPWVRHVEEKLGVPVIVDRPAVSVVMSRELLELQRPHIIAPSQSVTHQQLLREMVPPPEHLVAATVAVMRQELAAGRPQLENIARRLALGSRTLQRRLQDEGTSFRILLESVLKERAIDLIHEGKVSFDNISILLGYSSNAQFSRAVNSWTGVPPGRLRKTFLEQRA
jgi:AraC-like DNA-binding protein